MEDATLASQHGVEDERVAGRGAETPLPPLASSSSLPTAPLHGGGKDTHGASSSSHAGRQVECWICFDTRSTRANPIVTHRCRCRGSVGFVHQKCIDRWVIQEHNRACRSCGAPYRLIHSEYPANAYLPSEPKERKAFLARHFVRPLLTELAEAVSCILLRFLYLPLLLGTLYNWHRVTVLLWIVAGKVQWPWMVPINATSYPTTVWLVNADVAAAASTVDEDSGYAACLAAWADTFLFGLIVCTVMNAIAVASRKWRHYFQRARKQLEREVAAAADAAAAAAAAANVDLDGDAGLGPDMGAVERDGDADAGEDGADRVEGVAEAVLHTEEHHNAVLDHLAAAMELEDALHLMFPDAPMGDWHADWGLAPLEANFDPDVAGGYPATRWIYEAREEDGYEPDGTIHPADGADAALDNGAAAAAPAAREGESDDDDDEDSDEGEDAESSTSDSGSDGDERESDTDADAIPRLSLVDELFDMVEWLKSGAGGGGFQRLLPSLMSQLRYGVVMTLLLRCPLGRLLVAAASVVVVAGWRFRHSRNVLTTPKRRFQEVAERVPLLSPESVHTLFYVYLVDAFFFYVVLPELGGMMLHYALSPYMDVGLDRGFLVFFHGLTVWKLTVYWGIGALLVMLLTAMELLVVSALFANGVELFFVRSFDARWDSVLGYWRCVITQVFDSDPPRIVYGFVRVAVVELLVLLLFVRLPFWSMLELRDALWHDGPRAAMSASPSSPEAVEPQHQPTKMSFTFALHLGYDLDQDVSFVEWRRAEVLQLLDERVLVPFGAIYAEMIGSRVSFLEKRNVSAPVLMDPLVAAAVFVTNATPAELWQQVWGSMSDHAVFVLDLIDRSAAQRVAEQSEGFRETLARVRAPLEWARQATLRSSVCDTLTALTSPTDWAEDASNRLSAVELEALLEPPNIVLPLLNTSAARNRQIIYEAWQRAHYQATQHARLLSHADSVHSTSGFYPEGSSRRTPRIHSVNVANCYLSFLQVTQPFVRLSRWQDTVTEWWSMLLLRNTCFSYGVIASLYIWTFFTAAACFGVFPLQRAQLRLLLPFVQWVGRNVVQMEDYLFDPEQTRAVEDFVRADVEDELVLPPMVEPLGFNRREDYIDDSLIPPYVVARRVVVSVIFFIAAAVMVWTVPVLCGTLLLSFTTNALPVLIGSTLLSFFMWSPTLLCRAAMFGTVLTGALMLALPLLFMVYIAPTLELLWECYPTLVEETFQRLYNVQQMVGPCSESGGDADWYADADSSGWSGSDHDEDYARRRRQQQRDAAAEAEADEWESIDSNEPMEREENVVGEVEEERRDTLESRAAEGATDAHNAPAAAGAEEAAATAVH